MKARLQSRGRRRSVPIVAISIVALVGGVGALIRLANAPPSDLLINSIGISIVLLPFAIAGAFLIGPVIPGTREATRLRRSITDGIVLSGRVNGPWLTALDLSGSRTSRIINIVIDSSGLTFIDGRSHGRVLCVLRWADVVQIGTEPFGTYRYAPTALRLATRSSAPMVFRISTSVRPTLRLARSLEVEAVARALDAKRPVERRHR